MNSIANINHNIVSRLHETIEFNQIESLINRYNTELQCIKELSNNVLNSDSKTALTYFLQAKKCDLYGSIEDLFEIDAAAKILNTDYWRKLFNLTDIFRYMPQSRREKWDEQIDKNECPVFEREIVYHNLEVLLSQRYKFFAERVSGVFFKLSGEHVTNRPEGFSKRMIYNFAYYSRYGLDVNTTCAGYLADLRMIIHKLCGIENRIVKEGHDRYSAAKIMAICAEETGVWHEIDGGLMKIKAFKKGTMHIEIASDIAILLNEILGSMYPTAIPAKFRTRNKGRSLEKIFKDRTEKFDNLIPSIVIEKLIEANRSQRKVRIRSTMGEANRSLIEILKAVGGKSGSEPSEYIFDYNIENVLNKIILSGMMPDKKSHQFYSTPESLAKKLIVMAGIETHHRCLEPSAGTGSLARQMNRNTLCIEFSSLNCLVMKEKGLNVINEDFLKFSSKEKFDRICMNPPFFRGSYKPHVFKAIKLLKEGGRLAAILPSNAIAEIKEELESCKSFVFSDPIENAFNDANVTVRILVVEA